MSENPLKIRRLFEDFLLLRQIKNASEGISGYQLHKEINSILKLRIEEGSSIESESLSQSLVYRFLDDFHKKDFVTVDRVVIGNRLQGLYKITKRGKKRLEVISQTLQKLIPVDLISGNGIEDILSGSISPIDVMLKTIPEEEKLTRLKQLKQGLTKILVQVEREISELENTK